MSALIHKELEFKYYADSIDMLDFMKLIGKLNPEWLIVSSYDDYFVNKKNEFIRYRYHDDVGELTIKRKTLKTNNNNRIEINIPTAGKSNSSIEPFINLLGFNKNFSIFKTCNIATFEKVIVVYYIVYDENMDEKHRFIEIEAKESYNWLSEQDAWSEIVKYEKLLKPLGLSSKNRLKKSLFEMFKK